MTTFEGWLRELGLDQYHEVLTSNAVDFDVVGELTEDDLRELGFPLGDRKRMLRGIAELDSSRAAPAPAADEPSEPVAAQPAPARSGSAGDELRQLTLMFVDLVGSTRLSTELGLEEYRETLQSYQNCCLGVIRKHFGFIAQFLGDGIVAYFGYPVAEEDDAERAVLSGLEIVSALRSVVPETGRSLEVRIGIATGDVLIGDIVGAGESGGHFAMGEVPNLAARIQGAAEINTVAISASTHRLLGSNFDCTFDGDHSFKGFRDAVGVWIVHGARQTERRFDTRQRGAISPLIGREEERRLLESRWEEARDGRGQVVLISGEAGIGKSRLAEAMIERARRDRALKLTFQCSPYHQGSFLHPVVSHLAHTLSFAETDGSDEKRAKINALMRSWGYDDSRIDSAFGALLSGEQPDAGDPLSSEEQKELVVTTLLERVDDLASRKPVLLLFEDLHWIDPSSEELLDRFVGRLDRTSVLVVGTYRPDYRARWTGQPRVTTLSLSRLDGQHSDALVEHLLDEGEIAADLREQITARAEGVPLFVEEMVRMVLERQKLAEKGIEPDDRQIELPSTLKDLLQAKIDHLPDARDIVSVCAALGRDFSVALVSAVAGPDERMTRGLLKTLVDAELLTERGGAAAPVYSFRHALIQEAAYDAILPTRAQKLHSRIATALDTDFPGIAEANPEVVAQHFARANMPEQARDKWSAAASLSLSRSAIAEAIAHVEAALAENAKIDDSDERDRAEIEIRKVYNIALNTREFGSLDVRQNFERLHELLSKTGAPGKDAALSLHVRLGSLLMEGDPRQALSIGEQIMTLAEGAGDPTLLALAEHDLAMSHFMLGMFEEAIERFDRALTTRRQTSAEEILNFHAADIHVVDSAMRAWALALGRKDSAEVRTELSAAVAAAESEPHDFSRCFALNILAASYQALDDIPAVLDLVATALEISTKRKFRYWDAWSAIFRGWARARTVDPAGGISELQEGIRGYLDTGSKQITLYAWTLLADAYLAAGEIEEGLSAIARVHKESRRIGVKYQQAMTREVEAGLHRAADGAPG